MTTRSLCLPLPIALLATVAAAGLRVSGRVIVAASGAPASGAEVVLEATGDTVHADAEGRFAFDRVDPGSAVTLRATLGFLSGEAVFVPDPGAASEHILREPIRIGFRLATREHITVTATSGELREASGFGSLASFGGLGLVEGNPSLAELLEGRPGIAIRSLGPGPARPILRGFDGDRVLVLEDGVRTGDLSSQAAEHGMAIDPSQAERVEVLVGPATLLYGAGSVGGAVNVISMGAHLAHHPASGFRGRANLGAGGADGGSQAGARVEAGGSRWFAWGGGNTRRTGDYRSPLGVVTGSAAAMDQGEAGFGFRGGRSFGAVGFRLDDSRFGVPLSGMLHGQQGEEEETVEVAMNRRQARADFGLFDLGGFFEEAGFTVRLSDFAQDEIESGKGGPPELETRHDNRSLVLRGELEAPGGRVRSRTGVWAHFRNFGSAGEEALAPDTRQTSFAAFSYNEIRVSGRLGLRLGARLEQNAYDAEDRPEREEEDEGPVEGFEAPAVVDRDFLGLSASAGIRWDLGAESALVGTAILTSRAPALEELYNFGLDAGIQAFEIGDPSLDPEVSRGFDLSIRRSSRDFSGSIGAFHHDINDFTYGATSSGGGAVVVISSEQARARHYGFEADTRLRLGAAELSGNASWVESRFPDLGRYAPRIPPLNGQLKLAVPIRRLWVAPRMRWAARMDRLYAGETPTDGYAIFDLSLTLLILTERATHGFSLVAHNLTDAVYRHHTSIIKDIAAQPGRGIRLGYAIRFF